MVRFSIHNLASFNCFYRLLASWNLVLFDKIGDSQFIDFEFSFNYMNPHPPSLPHGWKRSSLLCNPHPSTLHLICNPHHPPHTNILIGELVERMRYTDQDFGSDFDLDGELEDASDLFDRDNENGDDNFGGLGLGLWSLTEGNVLESCCIISGEGGRREGGWCGLQMREWWECGAGCRIENGGRGCGGMRKGEGALGGVGVAE
ncbi:hypothetical protein ACFX13_030914 [Malus domestica]